MNNEWISTNNKQRVKSYASVSFKLAYGLFHKTLFLSDAFVHLPDYNLGLRNPLANFSSQN